MCVPHSQVTELIIRWRDGDLAALEQLVPLVYVELRKLARSHRKREFACQSLDSASRFLAGLSLEEIAMGISQATVSREWTTARRWLRHEMTGTAGT
jgi:hypothetical protein